MNNPKFSLITISYNHAEFIRKTIDSVFEQNYPNFEHIIIDGGSTDATIDILNEYPHLNWVSEPDRGISHALNKGFQKVSGDIVAWINSDDWYEPGTFEIVAKAIQQSEVVMGNAVEADRAGNPVKTVKNYPRTYFDLLRYWVPHGWLAQPSIFFTKKALESVRLLNGDYIDESFHYSMDYELWLRLGKLYPFTNHVDRVFSHYRVYGENKTGRTFASPQRELGRAFRSSANNRTGIERKVTFILPVTEIDDSFVQSINSIIDQEVRDYDLLIVNGSKDKDVAKRLKDAVSEFEEATTVTNFRLIPAPGASIPQTQKIGIENSRSQLIAVIRPGDTLPKDFMLQTINGFAHDTYGVHFALPEDHPLRKTLCEPQAGILQVNSLLSLNEDFIPFVMRKIILEELGAYSVSQEASWVTFREFILRTVNQGWLIKGDSEIKVKNLAVTSKREQILSRLRTLFCKTYLFSTGARSVANDIFYPIRSDSPYSPSYPAEQLKTANDMLAAFPKEWINLNFSTSIEHLQKTINEVPYFRPAWYLLSVALKDSKREREANEIFGEFIRTNPDLSDLTLE